MWLIYAKYPFLDLALIKLPNRLDLPLDLYGLVADRIQIYDIFDHEKMNASDRSSLFYSSINDLGSLYEYEPNITTAGWGATEAKESSLDLMAISLKVASFGKPHRIHSINKFHTFNPICYSTYRGKEGPHCRYMIRLRQNYYRGICSGDIGGKYIITRIFLG